MMRATTALILAAGLATAAFLVGGIYQMTSLGSVGGWPHAYRMNRFTGATELCVTSAGCTPVRSVSPADWDRMFAPHGSPTPTP
jgi:hypothetical protein